MKVALYLIVLAYAFAQDSVPVMDGLDEATDEGKLRIKGLNEAVRQGVTDALTLAGYAIPSDVGKKEWKKVKKEAIANGFEMQAIEQAAITKFLDQGVTDGSIDAEAAAAAREHLAKRFEKQNTRKVRKEVKAVSREIANAVRDAQDGTLIEEELLKEDSTKKDRKVAVKQAAAAGIDLDAIAAEVSEKILGTVDSEIAAGHVLKVEKMTEKKAQKQQAKQQAKEEKKETRQQAKHQKQEARQEKKDLRVVRRGVSEAVKVAQAEKPEMDLDVVRKEATAKYLASVDPDLAATYTAQMEAKKSKKVAEREAKKQAKKDKKAAEKEAKKQAKKDKKAALKQAKKDKRAADREAKKENKAAEKEAKKQAKKDKKAAENQAKKDKKAAENQAKKESKVAGRLQKKVKSSKKD